MICIELYCSETGLLRCASRHLILRICDFANIHKHTTHWISRVSLIDVDGSPLLIWLMLLLHTVPFPLCLQITHAHIPGTIKTCSARNARNSVKRITDLWATFVSVHNSHIKQTYTHGAAVVSDSYIFIYIA